MPTQLTPQGLYVETYEETRADIVSRIRQDVSPTANTEEDSLLGNLISIVATKQRELGEALEAVWSSFDPDSNGGAAQDNIAAITGTLRRDATYSRLEGVEYTVDPGTYPAGTLVAHVDGDPTIRFANAEDVVNDGVSPDVVTADAVSETPGPVRVFAGQLTVIAGAVSGWAAVSNPSDAIVGRDVESDAELRVRREQELSAQGSTSAEAVRAAILREHTDTVESALVLENVTETTDANGVPPHSIEAIVYAPGIDEDALAETIFRAKAAGIRAHGTETKTVTDSQGIAHSIGFSYQEDVDLYVRVNLEIIDGTWVGDSEFILRFVDLCNAYYGLGRDVKHSRLVAFCHQVPGVFGVVKLEVSDDGESWVEADWPITYREIARFDTGRVTVESAILVTE